MQNFYCQQQLIVKNQTFALHINFEIFEELYKTLYILEITAAFIHYRTAFIAL